MSALIEKVREQDESAANELCRKFLDRLASFADRKLRGLQRHVDGDDVAVSCLDLLCKKLGDGNYPDLANRDDLWRLLVRMAEQKAIDRRRKESAIKRGGGEIVGESVFLTDGHGLAGIAVASETLPETDLEDLDKSLESLTARLPNAAIRETVMLSLAGRSTQSIAEQQGVSVRTVQMRLKAVADDWKEAV